jgi:hypothetical protein
LSGRGFDPPSTHEYGIRGKPSRSGNVNKRFAGAGITGAEFHARFVATWFNSSTSSFAYPFPDCMSRGTSIVEDQLAVFVVHIQIEIHGKRVAADKNDVIKALRDWDHHLDDEASRADSAGIGRGHGKPARGVTHGHVITRVLGFGRVRVNERRKRKHRNATARD